MTVATVWANGYRSLVDLRVPLGPLTVVVGENGSGKTNLYRVLRLLSRGAAGRLARTLLEEGGMPSVLWAGAPAGGRRAPPVRCVLGADVDGLSYELALGLPHHVPSNPFTLDPQIKDEAAWVGPKRTRHSTIADRAGTSATATDVDDALVAFPNLVDPSEPLIAQLGEPARSPQPGVFTSVLADDGSDLAAALATIERVGDAEALAGTVHAAFPGCRLQVTGGATAFAVQLAQPGLNRPMAAHELSDGTLRFLCLAAALLTPRPPELLVFNEPETSLHPTLLHPLARLIADASRTTQILITTHATALATDLASLAGAEPVRLQRGADGVTTVSSR